jgi:hypothetical protein
MEAMVWMNVRLYIIEFLDDNKNVGDGDTSSTAETESPAEGSEGTTEQTPTTEASESNGREGFSPLYN